MNNLAKREIINIDLTRITQNPWVRVGAVVMGGYMVYKLAFGLLGLAWTVISWLFWPVVIGSSAYFVYKKYLRGFSR